MTLTRPALRYHGGKWMLAPWIISHFPQHRIYTEAFGGGASVLLRKARSYAEIYNDLDGEIVNLFRVFRHPEQASELLRLVTLTPYARQEFEESYTPADDPVEQARRTLVRSYLGFGSFAACGSRSGFRTGMRKSGTSADHDWMHYPDHLRQAIERLRGVTIEHLPAVELLRFYDDAKALHYVDPPYPESVRGNYGAYRMEMSDADHRDLAGVLRGLKGMVVLSGYACDLYDLDLYPDWQRITRQTHADGARDRTEVLWVSPNALTRPNLGFEGLS
jgi:DNA adenine methylase